MKITKHGFSSILEDNDEHYIQFIISALKHSDPEAELSLYKEIEGIKVIIKPSEADFKQHIINDILWAHRLLALKVIFSKSLALQKIVSYDVSF